MSLAVTPYKNDQDLAGLPLDEDGFLIDRKLWNRDLAERLAVHSGVGSMGPTHWLVIDFLRDRYERVGALPPMRHLCRKVGVPQGEVKHAFGTCRAAWQIAGLPNPGPEVLSYMN